MNEYLLYAGIALLVALYMFTALKFNVMMYLFLLKPAPASVLNLDPEANRRTAKAIGRVLCPLIGTIALLAAAFFIYCWRMEILSQQNVKIWAAQHEQELLEKGRQPLMELEITALYQGYRGTTEQTMQTSPADKARVAALIKEIAAALVPADVQKLNFQNRTGKQNLWKMEFEKKAPMGVSGGKNGMVRIFYFLDPDTGTIELSDLKSIEVCFSAGSENGVLIKVPEKFRAAFSELQSLQAYPGGQPPVPTPAPTPLTTPTPLAELPVSEPASPSTQDPALPAAEPTPAPTPTPIPAPENGTM
jgi:cell division septation protein DedD